MRSSSSMVTPGSRCSATIPSVSWTSSPARATPSISCTDLRMIMPPPPSSPGLNLVERLGDLVEDALDRAVGMDADHVAARRAIVLDERSRLGLVQVEPPLDRLGRVV